MSKNTKNLVSNLLLLLGLIIVGEGRPVGVWRNDTDFSGMVQRSDLLNMLNDLVNYNNTNARTLGNM